MKKLLVATLLTLATTQVFAQSSKATLFYDVARQAVKATHGQRKDKITMDLKDMNHVTGDLTETWEVQINNPKNGSAIYDVKVTQKEDLSKTVIEINYIQGN